MSPYTRGGRIGEGGRFWIWFEKNPLWWRLAAGSIQGTGEVGSEALETVGAREIRLIGRMLRRTNELEVDSESRTG